MVHPQLVGEAPGLGRREGGGERFRVVGGEVVEHQGDAVGVGEPDVDQVADGVRPVEPGPVLGDGAPAPRAGARTRGTGWRCPGGRTRRPPASGGQA
jgi:hypothetical protein